MSYLISVSIMCNFNILRGNIQISIEFKGMNFCTE